MSKLLEYLKTVDISTIVEHFQEKFGVAVKQEGDLYLFKYSQISANWSEEVTRECRGHILKFDKDGWRFMSRPWDKFFNQTQGQCPVFDENEFNKRLPNFHLVEKADGSCIQLWHDGERWRPTTLGLITPANVQDMEYTFGDLFSWTVNLGQTLSNYESSLDVNKTYLFELCCDENRIVTKYKSNHAVLLGVRDRNTGEYQDIYDGSGWPEPFYNVRLPFSYKATDLGLSSLEDVNKFVEDECSKTDKYGEYPEGFVIYEQGQPVAKLKNVLYLSLHCIGGGDIKHSMNQCIDAIFHDKIDDLYPFLSNRLSAFVDEVKEKINVISQSAINGFSKAKETKFENRKDFAFFLKDNVDKRIHPFFFENADKFLANDVPTVEAFESWLKKSYTKFEWKS